MKETIEIITEGLIESGYNKEEIKEALLKEKSTVDRIKAKWNSMTTAQKIAVGALGAGGVAGAGYAGYKMLDADENSKVGNGFFNGIKQKSSGLLKSVLGQWKTAQDVVGKESKYPKLLKTAIKMGGQKAEKNHGMTFMNYNEFLDAIDQSKSQVKRMFIELIGIVDKIGDNKKEGIPTKVLENTAVAKVIDIYKRLESDKNKG